MTTKMVLGSVAIAFIAYLLLATDVRSDQSAAADVLKARAELAEAFSKGDTSVLRTMLADDKVAIMPFMEGAQTKAQQIETLADLKIDEYSPGKIKVTVLSSDVVLLNFPLKLRGSFKGKPLAERSYASSVWVKHDGRWQEALYQETAL